MAVATAVATHSYSADNACYVKLYVFICVTVFLTTPCFGILKCDVKSPILQFFILFLFLLSVNLPKLCLCGTVDRSFCQAQAEVLQKIACASLASPGLPGVLIQESNSSQARYRFSIFVFRLSSTPIPLMIVSGKVSLPRQSTN